MSTSRNHGVQRIPLEHLAQDCGNESPTPRSSASEPHFSSKDKPAPEGSRPSATKEPAPPKISNDKGLRETDVFQLSSRTWIRQKQPLSLEARRTDQSETEGPSERDPAKPLAPPSGGWPRDGLPCREPHSSSQGSIGQEWAISGSQNKQGEILTSVKGPRREVQLRVVLPRSRMCHPKRNQGQKLQVPLQPKILDRPTLRTRRVRGEPRTSHGRKQLAPMGHQDDLSATCQVKMARGREKARARNEKANRTIRPAQRTGQSEMLCNLGQIGRRPTEHPAQDHRKKVRPIESRSNTQAARRTPRARVVLMVDPKHQQPPQGGTSSNREIDKRDVSKDRPERDGGSGAPITPQRKSHL